MMYSDAMDILVTLFYLLFCICVVYPPTEFVSAGFTIDQIFDSKLGSENMNFVGYHMKRITLTVLIHASLPLGYVFCLRCAGLYTEWLLAAAALTATIPLLFSLKLLSWWEDDSSKHPVVKALLPYVTEGSDWRVVAANFNVEFRSVDKVSIQLTANSKLVATETWLVKVSLYNVNACKQSDSALVATGTDIHELTLSGEDEVQYINIEVIPSREVIPRFTFRLSSGALRDLQPRLLHPVRVPDHLTVQPTLIERFITVFKQHVDENPTFYVDQEPELCIGCMQARADVKLDKRCEPTEPHPDGQPSCQQCNCRVLWCASCLARWVAARAGGPGGGGGGAGGAGGWLAARGTCPLCRARFCLQDVCPVRTIINL